MAAFRESKENIRITVLGGVDSGKSTMLGHLLCQSGAIDKRSAAKVARQAAEAERATMAYAWLVDRRPCERQQGTTLEGSLCRLQTATNTLDIQDCAGYRDFLNNAFVSSRPASVAVIVVAAALGEAEASFAIGSALRCHLSLVAALGIRRIIVCINKMDAPSVAYRQERFQEVRLDMEQLMKRAGLQDATTVFVPISAWTGENLLSPSPHMPWHQEGTLWQTFERLSVARRALSPGPLRLVVREVDVATAHSAVVVVDVVAGVLRQGMSLLFAPLNIPARVESIESNYVQLDHVVSPHTVILKLSSSSSAASAPSLSPSSPSFPSFPSSSSTSSSPSSSSLSRLKGGFIGGDATEKPPRECESFTARVVVTADPKQLKVGQTALIDCHPLAVQCRVAEIVKKEYSISKEMGVLKTRDVAIVRWTPTKPMCLEPSSSHPQLAAFTVSLAKNIIAIGSVLSVDYPSPSASPSSLGRDEGDSANRGKDEQHDDAGITESRPELESDDY